jgi:hypothetical protein
MVSDSQGGLCSMEYVSLYESGELGCLLVGQFSRIIVSILTFSEIVWLMVC